jgi:hypothetical protein
MDINARYTALCAELGHLDRECAQREERREAIRAELDVLRRLAESLGPPAQPAPTTPAPDAAQ